MRRVVSRRFDFAPSWRLRAAIAVSHVATAALVIALPLDLTQTLFGAWLALALGARAWQKADGDLVGLIIRSDGTLVALGADGRTRSGRLVAGSVVLPAWIAVAWRADGEWRTRTIRVPGNRLAERDRRELRVYLRYATSGSDAGEPASQARASISAPLSAFVRPARRWT